MKKIIEYSKVFHSLVRLEILCNLLHEDLTYRQLKEICQCSDGNLSTHTRFLVDKKFITLTKNFVDLKPQTTYQITDKGREELFDYVRTLNEYLAKPES